jgi:hypothetical protein
MITSTVDDGMGWRPDHILVGDGASESLRPASEALANSGDFLRSLHTLWRDLATETGDLPDRGVLTPERLRPWLGAISVYQETIDGDFLIKLDGTRIVAWTGRDWTNRRVSKIEGLGGHDLMGGCRRVLERRCPAVSLMFFLVRTELKPMHRLLLPVVTADRARRQVLMALWPADQSGRQ